MAVIRDTNISGDLEEKLGKNMREVDVTVAMIGDSRTGKSETAEKMEGILNMNIA